MPNAGKTEQVYQFIRGYVREHGYAPALREISAATEISMPSLGLCLTWLEAQGRIRRRVGTARSIVLLEPDQE